MDPLIWIIAGGLAMSAIAMVGGMTALLRPKPLERTLLALVALAAGMLLGSAFFHMVPEGLRALDPLPAAGRLVGGFTVFLALDRFLYWHHTRHAGPNVTKPFTYLTFLGDGLRSFLGDLGIAGTFLLRPSAGILAFIAAAAHEAPQELGDFGVLVHGGWSPKKALAWNVASALTFPVGAVLAYVLAQHIKVAPAGALRGRQLRLHRRLRPPAGDHTRGPRRCISGSSWRAWRGCSPWRRDFSMDRLEGESPAGREP